MRVRRSPRAALGSADSDPAKFESKILRPQRLGKRRRELVSPKSESAARGGDSGVREASQGGHLPAEGLPTGRDIGRSAGPPGLGDRPRASSSARVGTDPRPGRPGRRPRSPQTRVPALPLLLPPLQTLCPFSLSNEVSLEFEFLLDRLQTKLITKRKAAILKVPEGRASKAVTGKADGSSPLGLSRVTVSRMGWLRGRSLKIWAKDHTLKTQRRRLNRSRGQANLGGLAPSRPRRGQRLAVRGWDVASERRRDAAGF